jgi:peptidoglycan-associated lipoprotein
MKASTIACLAAAALLAACGSKDTGSSEGAGGANGANPYGSTAGGAGTGGVASRALPGSQEDLVQSAGDRIFFATDQSTLNDQARATLDRQADWLQRNPTVSVWAAGNCDERGTQEYNLALGQRRANSDRDYLVAHGIPRNRIETISYGSSRPVNGASTPEAWALNRNAITSVK